MAWQHFYSRVPARVSMYNKADSFDTFAHSRGLEREFVERELAPVYENKLSKNDVLLVRKGEMPCVYVQCCTRSGVLVQNCIRYLPLDYTGERSSYLSHCLIYSPEEKETVLSVKDRPTLNPELFTADIEDFEITAPNAAPNPDLPTVDYLPGQELDSAYIMRDLDPETAKIFLYAILSSLCGKGKNIFFKLPGDDKILSQRSVRLFNEVLSILPYQLRGKLSFVSYVNDPAQYANFKLKGVSAGYSEAGVKGVYFDLLTNLIVGIRHDEVVANMPLLDFFYSLLRNDELRLEFLSYMQRTTAAVPALQNLNLKTLNDLVFLFQCSCGLYPEQTILPSDAKIYDYLCAYEKYRIALREDYRLKAYKCLQRYPDNHTAFPKNIFSKVTRLYGAEPLSVKRVFMNIVLELIHTDIMRDKLFTFIRNNYGSEEAEMKKLIIADLSRVFYGGFLQNQLLAFFTEQFETEPEESRTQILEKLLLSIRTVAVQEKILAFLDRHYINMSDAHKESFYETFLEMLPECDSLSTALVGIVNRNIQNEPESRKEALTEKLTAILELDYRRKEHRLLPILAAQPGFCLDMVIRLAFGPWQSRKLHGEYLQLLAEKPVWDKTAALVRITELVPGAEEILLQELDALFDPGKNNLWVWLEAASLLPSMPEALSKRVDETIIEPAVCRTMCDVFDTSYRPDGLQLLEEYLAQTPEAKDCENYRIVRSYRDLTQAAQRSDSKTAAELTQTLAQEAALAGQIGSCISRSIDPKAQSPETVLILRLAEGSLRGKPRLAELYRGLKGDGAPEEAMARLLPICESFAQLLTEESQAELASAFAADLGRGARQWLRSQPGAFATALEEQVQQKASPSIWAKLFGKKK